MVFFFCQYGKEPLILKIKKKESHVNTEGMTVSTEYFSHIKEKETVGLTFPKSVEIFGFMKTRR